jgi:hypothetical protein
MTLGDRSGQVVNKSADELVMRHFAGAHGEGIGWFSAEPASGRWSWSDAAYQIFGYQVGSVTPTWSLIMSHIPTADRAAAEAGYRLACSRVGPFSWSHRIRVRQTTRSILVLGETLSVGGWHATKQVGLSSMSFPLDAGGLCCQGYVIDVTEFWVEAARAAATEAVHSSARHRAVIEQAKGALMLAFGIDADAAFALLVRHSQRSNRKLHSVAADVMAHVQHDGLSGQSLRLDMDRILTNGRTPANQLVSGCGL